MKKQIKIEDLQGTLVKQRILSQPDGSGKNIFMDVEIVLSNNEEAYIRYKVTHKWGVYDVENYFYSIFTAIDHFNRYIK